MVIAMKTFFAVIANAINRFRMTAEYIFDNDYRTVEPLLFTGNLSFVSYMITQLQRNRVRV